MSLLPIPAKIFEEFLVDSIKGHLNINHLLSQRQYGFLKGKSASDLLLLLSNEWSKKLDTGEESRVVALDIAGAFDTVWHSGLIARLQSLGIEGDLLALLRSYLDNRSMLVVLQGEDSNNYPISAGVPQGSLLGPLLWNIFFDEVLQLSPSAVAYADDLTITRSYTREGREEATRQLQQEINIISQWGRTWQIKFAAEKSQALVISRMRDQGLNRVIRMEGSDIKSVTHLKVLGVTFDSSLCFDKHIKDIARIASMKLSYLRRITNLLTAESIQQLYKSQIRSSMEYAALAWSGAAQTHLAVLDKIQDRASRLVTNARAVDHVISGLDTLQHRRDVGGLSVFYKANIKDVEHLAPLRLPLLTPVYHTRAAEMSQGATVLVPHPHSTHYQRAFMYRYSNLWNELCKYINVYLCHNVHMFKDKVNAYLTNVNI